MSTYRLEFITPLFSRGAYDDRPEIRPPSIRGQLHWWFRALGGSWGDERQIFGGVHGGATASKVVVRVSNVNGQTGSVNTLPHKEGGAASPKLAYRAGTHLDLHILTRLGGLDVRQQAAFERTLEAWLLLGTLGLRATRAAGSFAWQPLDGGPLEVPASFPRYEERCRELLRAARLRFALLGHVYAKAEDARRDVSNTLGGREDKPGQSDLSRLHDPLGRVFGGRKTSPLRFRIVGIGDQYRIAAVWDNRESVTGNSPADLAGMIRLLAERKPALGRQLKESALAP
jgi:hypothetical protein